MNLAALLFDVARRLPQQRAVSDDRQAWNYRELMQRVAGVAGGLRARGVVPGDRVLLSLENCGEFVELMFGCWAAGLCAVPANARLHPREVEYGSRYCWRSSQSAYRSPGRTADRRGMIPARVSREERRC